jgi:hypothetical protein
MTPTPEQIAAGVAKAKEMLAASHLPSFITHQVTDDQLKEGITEILVAALATTGVEHVEAAPSPDTDDESSPAAG